MSATSSIPTRFTPDPSFMRLAVEEARKCVSTGGAYNVGAVLVTADGRVLATGFSRELPGNTHAEECAIMKAGIGVTVGVEPSSLTMYCTMEPCGRRLSGKVPCVHLIRDAGIRHVVMAVYEPDVFIADTSGVSDLACSGVEVHVIDDEEMRASIRALNAHLDVPVA